jgi:hypothetical protein
MLLFHFSNLTMVLPLKHTRYYLIRHFPTIPAITNFPSLAHILDSIVIEYLCHLFTLPCIFVSHFATLTAFPLLPELRWLPFYNGFTRFFIPPRLSHSDILPWFPQLPLLQWLSVTTVSPAFHSTMITMFWHFTMVQLTWLPFTVIFTTFIVLLRVPRSAMLPLYIPYHTRMGQDGNFTTLTTDTCLDLLPPLPYSSYHVFFTTWVC